MCEKYIGFSNEIVDLKPKFIKEEYEIKQAARKWDVENPEMPITLKIMDKIKISSRRPSKMKDKTIEDFYKELIEDTDKLRSSYLPSLFNPLSTFVSQNVL